MSDTFSVLATDIFGDELSLAPASLRVRRSTDSPAEGMSGSFPVSSAPREIVRVRVLRGGDQIFEGRPDAQRLTFSQDGMLLTLESRSKGAILLDNEAMPETVHFATTHAMFDRLIGRHGFILIAPGHTMLPEFTVRKGLTLWDAFSIFVRRIHGRLPFVNGDMVMISQTDPGTNIVIGGADLPFSRLEHDISYYNPISRVFIRDDEGSYSTFVSNPDTAQRQILRERYLIPAGEFAAVPRWDSLSRIRRSMRQMRSVQVTLPGYHEIRPGRGIVIEHPQIFLPNLLLDRLDFTLDSNGARTQLTLASALYD